MYEYEYSTIEYCTVLRVCAARVRAGAAAAAARVRLSAEPFALLELRRWAGAEKQLGRCVRAFGGPMADAAGPAMPPMSKFLPLGVMLLMNKYNLEEMGYKQHIEGAYVAVQFCCFATLLLIGQKIKAVVEPPDAPKMTIPEQVQMGQVVKPAMEQTNKEHDEEKWKEQRQQLLMGAVILSGIYYKFAYTMPLVLQCIMTPVTMLESPLFQIYMLGKEVPRPFPKPSPFGDLFPTQAEEPAPAPESAKKITAEAAAAALGATGLKATEKVLKETAAGKKKKKNKNPTTVVTANPAAKPEEKVD